MYLVLLSLEYFAEGVSSNQPHIIFIVADDLVSIFSINLFNIKLPIQAGLAMEIL